MAFNGNEVFDGKLSVELSIEDLRILFYKFIKYMEYIEEHDVEDAISGFIWCVEEGDINLNNELESPFCDAVDEYYSD